MDSVSDFICREKAFFSFVMVFVKSLEGVGDLRAGGLLRSLYLDGIRVFN